MTFRNNIPMQCVCAWCGLKQWTVEDKWVPYVPIAGNVIVKKGTCPDCEKKWQAEEKRVNDEIRDNERRLRDSLPKLRKRS